ncbi:MAG: hypothetical protein H6510_07805 [Acidobacteria bacterium]|nr:hypothetical protein [Acidobacteriota bacterium]
MGFPRFLIQYPFRILLGILIPPFVVGVLFLLSPRAYQSTLQYTWDMNSVDYEVFRARFYGKANLNMIQSGLQKSGQEEAAQKLKTWTQKQFIQAFPMQVTPSYIDYQNKQNLRLSFERSWAENIEKLENLSAKIITLNITGASPEKCQQLTQMIQANIQNALPLFIARDSLNEQLTALNNGLVTSELEMHQLEKNLLLFQSLKKELANLSPEKMDQEVALHFNEKGAAFLTLPMRRESVAQSLADVEANLQQKQEFWQVELARKAQIQRLLDFIDQSTPESFTVDNYFRFLESQMENAPLELKSFLLAHHYYVENQVQKHTPLVEDFFVEPMAKGTVFMTALTFMVSFSLTLAVCGLVFFIRQFLTRGDGPIPS